MDSAKQLNELSKVYMEAVYGGGKKEEKKDTRLVVTAADKKANTKAYQNYKAGNKAYKAADHLGEGKKADKDYDGDGKIESGKDEYFGSKDKAIKKAMGKELKDLQKAANTGKGEYVAKADKVKGVGESVESDEYIETVQKVKAAETQADIKRWGALKESGKFTVEELESMAWDIYEADTYKENYQAMRNPEKEEKKDTRSAREKRMADPKKGINSPAFKEFMRQQGM